MTSVLLGEHGGQQQTLAHFSATLDPVAAALLTHVGAVAAAEKAVMASHDIVTLLVPRAVSTV